MYIQITEQTKAKAKAQGMTLLMAPEGNLPTCPTCGNFNAMLDEYVHTDTVYNKWFKCRDCGSTIKASDAMVVIVKLEKPGQGIESVYHEIRTVPGKNF